MMSLIQPSRLFWLHELSDLVPYTWPKTSICAGLFSRPEGYNVKLKMSSVHVGDRPGCLIRSIAVQYWRYFPDPSPKLPFPSSTPHARALFSSFHCSLVLLSTFFLALILPMCFPLPFNPSKLQCSLAEREREGANSWKCWRKDTRHWGFGTIA